MRGEGITDKEQKLRGYIGDTDALDLFLAGIYQGKPRYYNKNISYIIKRMDSYSPDVLREALAKCLASKAYNARMLIEASETIRISHNSLFMSERPNATPSLEKYDISPSKTPIKSFEPYLNP